MGCSMNAPATVDYAALEDVRYYLRAWRYWNKSWRPSLGHDGQISLVRLMRPTVAFAEEGDDAAEVDSAVDSWIMAAVDAVMADLNGTQRAAINLIYMREKPGLAIVRSGRMTVADAERICQEAELAMIGPLRKKGVVLGGR